MGRWSYFARRVVLLVPVVWFGVTVTFFILRLGPLDPVAAILGPNVPPSEYARIEDQLGLNEPLWRQYLDFIHGLATFDLGRSYVIQNGRPAVDLIVGHTPRTLWLGF